MGLTSKEEDELKRLQLEELRMRANDRRQKARRSEEWQDRKGKAVNSSMEFADRVGLRYRASIVLLGLGFLGVAAVLFYAPGRENAFLKSHEMIAAIWTLVAMTTLAIGLMFVGAGLFKADLKKRIK